MPQLCTGSSTLCARWREPERSCSEIGSVSSLPASALSDPEAEQRASIPIGHAATPTASSLTRNVLFSLPSHALISGRRKKHKPMWVTAFWGKDEGVSGFLSLAKPQSATQRAWMYIFVCTGLKLLCRTPGIKAACCWVALRHGYDKLSYQWAIPKVLTGWLPLSSTCPDSHLFFGYAFHARERYKAMWHYLEFLCVRHIRKQSYKMVHWPHSNKPEKELSDTVIFTILFFLKYTDSRFCFSPKTFIGCDQQINCDFL